MLDDPFTAYQNHLLLMHTEAKAETERAHRACLRPRLSGADRTILLSGPNATQHDEAAAPTEARLTSANTAAPAHPTPSARTVYPLGVSANDTSPLGVSVSSAEGSPVAARGHDASVTNANAGAALETETLALAPVPDAQSHAQITQERAQIDAPGSPASNSPATPDPISTPISASPSPISIPGASTRPSASEDASAYSSSDSLIELFRRRDYATHLGYPLNTHLTLLFAWHDQYATLSTLDLVEGFTDKLNSFFRGRGIPCAWILKLFNNRAGGRGLHAHMMLHLPEAGYAGHAKALEAGLAVCFRKKLVARAQRYNLHRKRMSAIECYHALKTRKTTLNGAAVIAADRARIWANATAPGVLREGARQARARARAASVPFWLSWGRDVPYQPLRDEYADWELPSYLGRDADPSIVVRIKGEDAQLEDVLRNSSGSGWEPQSTKRPKVALRSSNNLKPRARKLDPSWTDPVIDLAERLVMHDPSRCYDPRSARRRARHDSFFADHKTAYPNNNAGTECSSWGCLIGLRFLSEQEISRLDADLELHESAGLCYTSPTKAAGTDHD